MRRRHELTDEQWERIKDHLPGKAGDPFTQDPDLLLGRVTLAFHHLILSGWTRLTFQGDPFS